MKASEHGGNIPSSVGEWGFHDSDDGTWSNFGFKTREDAIAEARGFYGDDRAFYVGVGGEVELYAPDADGMVERLCEVAYEAVGDVAEDYLSRHDVTKEDLEELESEIEKVVAAWLTKHSLWPGFCTIERIERVEPVPRPACADDEWEAYTQGDGQR